MVQKSPSMTLSLPALLLLPQDSPASSAFLSTLKIYLITYLMESTFFFHFFP